MNPGIFLDSTQTDWQNEVEDTTETDEEEALAAADYGDEDFTHHLAELAVEQDNPWDVGWVPVAYRRKQALNKGENAETAKNNH